MAGTIHLAPGRSYPEVGGKNESGIHVHLIKDMLQEAEILFDGEVLYRDGAWSRSIEDIRITGRCGLIAPKGHFAKIQP